MRRLRMDALGSTPTPRPDNARAIVAGALQASYRVLVVGPPPAPEPERTVRHADLAARYATVCADLGVPFLDVIESLARAEIWWQEVAAGDVSTETLEDTQRWRHWLRRGQPGGTGSRSRSPCNSRGSICGLYRAARRDAREPRFTVAALLTRRSQPRCPHLTCR